MLRLESERIPVCRRGVNDSEPYNGEETLNPTYTKYQGGDDETTGCRIQ